MIDAQWKRARRAHARNGYELEDTRRRKVTGALQWRKSTMENCNGRPTNEETETALSQNAANRSEWELFSGTPFGSGG